MNMKNRNTWMGKNSSGHPSNTWSVFYHIHVFTMLPLDDHTEGTCLVKTLLRKNPMGQKSMVKKKEYNIFVYVRML